MAREYFEARAAMEAVDWLELLRRVKNGEVTVLDVRPAEYRAGHIPGALSFPVGELKARLKELKVVGRRLLPRPVLRDGSRSGRAASKKGFKAHRMEQGVVDWRARGWRVGPIARSPL